MDVRQFAFLAGQPSASLKNRDQFLGLPKRGIAFLLANVMFWQPLWAQADGIVVSAPGATLGQAGNGVPIVNIAAPNGSGLSHNQFQDYNVGANGVILNNATGRTQSTQLGGIILGNSNLNGRAASTILNEVNGGSPSQLRGYTEVAGQSAHVIVANPYGITCNGCGFINTPQATLTTGKPVIENGQVSRYQVDKGSVSLEGAGLNANNIDRFEIITRSAKLNAEIQAKNLAIIAGANDVDAKTLKATARAADPASAPQLAIDSSALGGMYAGAIKLVGTEAGVGVKLDGKMVASGGDIQLDANGHLSMVDAAATGAVNVKAQSLEAKGPVYAGTTLDMKTQGDLTSQNNLVAKDRITVNSGGQLTNNGIIEAGVNADNSRNTEGDVEVTAQTFNNAGKTVVASRDLKVMVTQTLSNQGGTLSGQRRATVSAGTLDNQNKGRVLSADSLNLTADTVLNGQGGLLNSAGQLTANLGHLNNNAGEVSSKASSTLVLGTMDNLTGLVMAEHILDITATGAVNNQGGRIGSNQSLAFKGQALDNTGKGRITAQQKLELSASHLNNSAGSLITNGPLNLTVDIVDNGKGYISSKGDLTAAVTTFKQQDGALLTEGNLTLTGGSLDNRNAGLVSASKLLVLNVDSIDNRAGEISSVQAVNLSGQTLNNSEGGKVLSDTALGLKVAQVINQSLGQLVSQGNTTLTGSTLDNSGGKLSAQSGLVITLDGALTNQLAGLISSEGTLTAHAGSLDNSGGSFSSAGQLQLTSAGALLNQGGRLVTDGGIELHSASLDNRQKGTISGLGPVSIQTGDFDNSHTGFVSSGDRLDLTAGQLTNQDGGRIGAAKALTASVTGLDQQGGQLKGDTSVSLDLNHGQLNNQGGLINAPVLVLNNLKGVNNQGGEISSAQAFTLAADSLNNDNGKLLGNQALSLRVEQALSSVKGMIAAASLDVRAGSLDNSGGTLTSRSGLELAVNGLITNRNQGLINASNALTLNGSGLDNQGGSLLGSAIGIDFGAVTGDLNNAGGQITTAGNLSIDHLRDLNNQGGELSSAQSLGLQGRTLDNSHAGKLISNNQLSLNASSLVNQGGGLLSGWEGVTINGGSLDNRNSGTVSSRSGNVAVTLDGALLNGNAGALVSQKVLTVNAASLDNSDKGIISSAQAQTLTVSGLLNNASGGSIDSGAALTLQAMALNNGGVINAQQALTYTGTTLDNSNGTFNGSTAMTLDLLGALTNTSGKLSAGGPLVIQRSTEVNNQGGTLSSQGLLSVLTGGLDNSNRGTLAAIDKLTVTSTGDVQNGNAGLIASANGDLQLTSASLGNAGGSLQGQGAVNLDVSGDIDSQNGKVIAQTGDLLIEAANLDNRGGVLSSIKGSFESHIVGVLKNGYGLSNNRQGGSIQAQSLNLNALGGIDNIGGRIAARAAQAIIVTGNFNNGNGGIYASGLLKVTANSLDNGGDLGGQIAGGQIDLTLGGALNNRKGIIESDSTLAVTAAGLGNQAGQLRALGSGGKTAFKIGGLFDNSNGVIESRNVDLDLDAGSFQNQSGSLLHVGLGTFNISMANLTSAGGNLVTRGGLTLGADSWTNSSVIQAGRLTLNINNLYQTGSGQLLASDSLIGTGGNWTNDGLIASDGTVNLNLGGSYVANGRLSSIGVLGLKAAQLSLGANSSIGAGSDATVSAGGLLTNYGRLTSAANMTLIAGGINNYGTLGSGQGMTTTTGALLNDHGLLFSGSDMGLRVDSLTNLYGDINSLGNLAVDRDGLGSWANSIVNRSGSIQSDGSMSLAASTLQNIRDIMVVNNAGLYTARITELPCSRAYVGDCDGGNRNGLFEVVQRSKLEVMPGASAGASLTSGGNLILLGGDFLNSSSTVATSGSLTAQFNNMLNQGVETGDTEDRRTYVTARHALGGRQQEAAGFTQQYWYESAGYNPAGIEGALAHFLGTIESEVGSLHSTKQLAVGDQSYAGIMQAGGAVNIASSNNFDNSVVRPGFNYVGSGTRTNTGPAGSSFSTHITVNQQLPPNLAQQQVNPVALPGFTLPAGQNGLFRLSGQGGSTPAATGPQSWTLGGASLGSAQRQPAPGDLAAPSVIDISAVDRAQGSQASNITRVQGLPDTAGKSNPQKYLIETNPALTDLKQFMSSDYLLSNLGYDPDASAKRLGDGYYEQRLIQQAVVARTGQRFIDGQTSDEGMFKYLMNNAVASKQELNLQLGVTLTSEQVAALTHDIVWMENAMVNGEQVLVPVLYLANANNRLAANGALIQGSDVTLIAGKDLDNAGTLRASNNLLAAGNDQVNSGLLEAGDRLAVLAANNMTNKAGGVIAGRDVSVTAVNGDVINERTVTSHQSSNGYRTEQRDFVDNAARIEASNGLTISAGRDINNSGGVLKSSVDTLLSAGRDVSISSAEEVHSNTLGDHHRDATITQNGSSVSVGRDLMISAGRDLNVVASQVDAKRDVAFSALGDLVLTSAADEQHSYGKTKKVTSQEDHEHQVSSSVTAGGNVLMSAGKDLELAASKVSATGEAYLSAGANLVLQSATNEDYSFFSKTKKSSSGKKSRLDETDSSINIASSVSSGTNTTLVAGNDLTVKGSEVTAEKGRTQLTAGNDVQILAAIDSSSARHESSSSKSSWGGLRSSKVEDKVAETQTQAVGSVIAGNTVEVNAKRDATITGSAVVSTQDLTVQAGRDLIINAAENTFGRSDMHKEKGHDFTGILTANKLGVDDITGNQRLNISSSKHNGEATQTTLTGSTIGSSSGNISLNAGRELGVVASDLVSTRDMSLTGSNVTITAGMESASQSSKDKASSLGVGRVMGGSVISTLNTIYNLRETVEATNAIDDPRLRAVKQAQLLMNVGGIDPSGTSSDLKDAAGAYADKKGGSGSLIKIGTELASTHSKNSSEQQSQTAKQSTVKAGGDLAIIATGLAADTAGDIHVVGSTLKGANTVLDAKNNITLDSAQNTMDRSNHGSNNRTAIGASFNLGAQNGFTLDLGAQVGTNMGNGHSVTQVNTRLDADALVLRSGKDTTLAGAQVKADSINAVVGGNLDIVSRQDSESSKSKQGSAGFGASLCIPPFCYGATVTASANLAAGNTNSDYKEVTDQSGLFAGQGGYNITVGQNTTLQGAVIASEASADKNRLSTDRLIVSDIKNKSEASSQSAGISLSYSSGGSGLGFGGSIPLALSESDQSKTRSAVSEGTIVVRNSEGANDLVGLNRDTTNANEKLEKPNQAALQTRMDLIRSSVELTQAVVGKVAEAEKQSAKERLEAAKTPQEVASAKDNLKNVNESWAAGGDKRVLVDVLSGLIGASLGGAGFTTGLGIVANTTAADTYKLIGDYANQQRDKASDSATRSAWDEGGAARVMLHALAGGVQGLAGGTPGANALGAGAAGLTAPLIAEKIAQMDLPVDVKKSLILGTSGLVAGGVGGVTGASAGMQEVQNNYLRHEDVQLLSKQLATCGADDTGCRMKVQLEAKRLSDANDAQLMACRDQACLDKHIAQIVEGAKSFGELYAADRAVDAKDKTTFGAISDIETNSLLVAANVASAMPGFTAWAAKNCESMGMTACQSKFTDAVKSGQFINSKGQVGGAIPAAFSGYETVLNVFGQTAKQPHEYTDVSSGCMVTLGGCGTLDQEYEALKRNAGPGGDGVKVVGSGDVSELYLMGAKLGYVAHLTDTSSKSVINVTLPGMHALDPGFVVRTVVPKESGGFDIDTRGWGTGSSPLFNSNSWAAGMVWGGNSAFISKQEMMNNNPVIKALNVPLTDLFKKPQAEGSK